MPTYDFHAWVEPKEHGFKDVELQGTITARSEERAKQEIYYLILAGAMDIRIQPVLTRTMHSIRKPRIIQHGEWMAILKGLQMPHR